MKYFGSISVPKRGIDASPESRTDASEDTLDVICAGRAKVREKVEDLGDICPTSSAKCQIKNMKKSFSEDEEKEKAGDIKLESDQQGKVGEDEAIP